MIYAVGILKNKQSELIDQMTDKSKTDMEKYAATFMYDELTEAIKILDKAFFERNVKWIFK